MHVFKSHVFYFWNGALGLRDHLDLFKIKICQTQFTSSLAHAFRSHFFYFWNGAPRSQAHIGWGQDDKEHDDSLWRLAHISKSHLFDFWNGATVWEAMVDRATSWKMAKEWAIKKKIRFCMIRRADARFWKSFFWLLERCTRILGMPGLRMKPSSANSSIKRWSAHFQKSLFWLLERCVEFQVSPVWENSSKMIKAMCPKDKIPLSFLGRLVHHFKSHYLDFLKRVPNPKGHEKHKIGLKRLAWSIYNTKSVKISNWEGSTPFQKSLFWLFETCAQLESENEVGAPFQKSRFWLFKWCAWLPGRLGCKAKVKFMHGDLKEMSSSWNRDVRVGQNDIKMLACLHQRGTCYKKSKTQLSKRCAELMEPPGVGRPFFDVLNAKSELAHISRLTKWTSRMVCFLGLAD